MAAKGEREEQSIFSPKNESPLQERSSNQWMLKLKRLKTLKGRFVRAVHEHHPKQVSKSATTLQQVSTTINGNKKKNFEWTGTTITAVSPLSNGRQKHKKSIQHHPTTHWSKSTFVFTFNHRLCCIQLNNKYKRIAISSSFNAVPREKEGGRPTEEKHKEREKGEGLHKATRLTIRLLYIRLFLSRRRRK